jgi:CHASE2 domain-containing sensor protein
MLWLLLIVFVLLLLGWALAWQSQPQFAFGILLGAGLAWLGVLSFKPYLTGIEEMPVWLPPLPVATVAVVLLVYGVMVWYRKETPVEKKESDPHHH